MKTETKKMLRCVNNSNWKALHISVGQLYEPIDDVQDGDGYVTVTNDEGDVASYHLARFEVVEL